MREGTMRPPGSWKSVAAPLAGISLLLALSAPANIYLQKLSADSARKREISLQTHWNPDYFRVLSFGQLPPAIDWIWLSGFLDDSGNHVAKGERAPLYRVADLITDLDPANFDVYSAGANYLTVIKDDNEGARDLLLKAQTFRHKNLPTYPERFQETFWKQQWSIPMTLAYVYLFELNDLRSASKVFQEAASAPRAPEYLPKLAARLKRAGGEYEVGMKLLTFMISGAKSEESKQKLEKKRLNLFVAQYRFDIEDRFRRFLEDQPQYRAKRTLSEKEMQAFWKKFQKENSISNVDPWGGRISLDSLGRVVTTTPYEKVFGLE